MSSWIFRLLAALSFVPFIVAQPVAPTPAELEALRADRAGQPPRAAAATPLTVNTASREEVRQFYRSIYTTSNGVSMGWTGNYPAGAAGDIASGYKDAVALRINFFRALVGIPAAITFNPTFGAKAQQAALMMSANNALSHFPPGSWTFFTAAGAEAAEKSNLSLGSAGPDAITDYMNDGGDNNAAVGHRRWLIYPQTREMGTGDVPGNDSNLRPANATWILDAQFGTTRPATRTTAVPYPPAGYVPYDLVWPRWSFSHPGASFANTTVTMTRGGQAVATRLEPISTGIGEPTLVWVYDGQDANEDTPHARPTADTTYTVNLNNVLIGGSAQNFTYQVTVFDPDVAGSDTLPVTVTGSSTPAVGLPNTYAVAKPAFAGSLDWRVLQLSAFAKSYNAEAGLDGLTATTSASYSVVTTGGAGAGSAAYHLAHPVTVTQTLALPETFLVGATAPAVTFLSRLGWATTTQTALVQVSVDDGLNWLNVYSQPGSGGAGESTYSSRSASLSAFSGRTIRVRFVYAVSGSRFFQTDNSVGWFIDNISLAGVQAVQAGAPTAVSSGTTFAYTPGAAGAVGLQARGVLFGAYPLEWGPVAQVTAAAATTFTTQPAGQTATSGGTATFTAAASGTVTYQWQLNGTALSGATNPTLAVSNVQPANTGLYAAAVTSGSGTTSSRAAILGISSSQKVIGSGSEIGAEIKHPNGNIFDQILLQGAAATIVADPGQVTRTSYIDLNDDIVQIEFAGAGNISLVLEGSSGPAVPLKYNQPTVNYMKGHVGIVITGANETTNLSVFSVGRATAFDPTGAYNILIGSSATNVPANNGSSLFVGHTSTNYDGFADIAFVAIASTDGKFGGLRTANASYFGTKGFTGVYAPNVQFTGPVFIGDIRAENDATPVLVIGSGANTRITGGDLLQPNGRAVQVSGLSQLIFQAGSSSHGTLFPAQTNRAHLEQDGVNVTTATVVNP